MAKPVAQFDITGEKLINVFPSAKIASQKLGIPAQNIGLVCKGTRKTAGKFVWKHINEIPLEKYRILFKTPDLTPIPDFPDYLATRDGRVFGKLKSKFISPAPSNQGYMKIAIIKNGKRANCSVHRLIAEVFCEKKEGCDVVNHLDGNPQNNHADNLEWTTSSGNTLHAQKEGMQKLGYRKIHQFTKDGKFVAEYPSVIAAAKAMGVSRGTMSDTIRKVQKTCKGHVFEYAESNKRKEKEGEEWRDIPSLKGYQASNTGKVYSTYTKRIMSTTNRKNGREIISLKGKGYLVHRLIAETFLGDIEGKHVLHIDDDQSNNHVDNLQVK